MNTNRKVSGTTRRTQIAEAALRIIAERGVRSLTTASLAREVGISEANLYRHFRSKDEILAESVDMIGKDLKANFEKAFEDSASPLKKLRKIFLLHLDYIEKNKGIPRLVFSEDVHAGSKELGERLFNIIKSYAGKLETIIKEGKKTNVIRTEIDPWASALMLLGMVQVITLRWSLSGFSFPLAQVGMKMWRNFEKCIRLK